MNHRASDRSAEDLDQLLDAHEHFAAAFALAEPFSDDDRLEAARRTRTDIAIYTMKATIGPNLVAWLRRKAGTYRGLESVLTGQGGEDEKEEDAE